MGLRAYLYDHNAINEDKDRNFEPFVETNWIYNSKQYGVKIGIEGPINKNLNLWGNVSQQIGDPSYSDAQEVFGIKYMY